MGRVFHVISVPVTDYMGLEEANKRDLFGCFMAVAQTQKGLFDDRLRFTAWEFPIPMTDGQTGFATAFLCKQSNNGSSWIVSPIPIPWVKSDWPGGVWQEARVDDWEWSNDWYGVAMEDINGVEFPLEDD